MDHETATRTRAIERYLLGEMPPDERELFEEHFFSCPACAEEVRNGALLVENTRTLLRRDPPERSPSDSPWKEWLRLPVLVPVFSALFLGAIASYQNSVTIPELRAPRALGPAVILDPNTRDGLPEIPAGAPLRFELAVDAQAGEKVLVELRDSSNRLVRKGVVAASGPSVPLDVYFPGSLDPGRYDAVVLRYPAGAQLARSSFHIGKVTTSTR
jgi:anti-sigma factor RsiW